jgi:hypothetical protein
MASVPGRVCQQVGLKDKQVLCCCTSQISTFEEFFKRFQLLHQNCGV